MDLKEAQNQIEKDNKEKPLIEKSKEEIKVEVPKRTYKKREVKQSQYVKEFRSFEEFKDYIENELPENTVPYYIYSAGVSLKHPMIRFATVAFKTVEKAPKISCDILISGDNFEKYINELKGKKIIGVYRDFINKRSKSDLQYLIVMEDTDEDIKYTAKNFFVRNSWVTFEQFVKDNPQLEIVYISSRSAKPIRRSAQIYFAIFKE